MWEASPSPSPSYQPLRICPFILFHTIVSSSSSFTAVISLCTSLCPFRPRKKKCESILHHVPTRPKELLQYRSMKQLACKQLVQGKAQESSSPKPSSPSSCRVLLRVMSRRRTWVLLFLIVNVVLLCCIWNLENLIFSWYRCQQSSSRWTALEASVLLGAAFGALSTAAALTVAVPAIAVAWITVVVGLAFSGKSQRTLLVEGRKASKEIIWFICKNSFKEGRVVAVVCAVLGYFALLNKG